MRQKSIYFETGHENRIGAWDYNRNKGWGTLRPGGSKGGGGGGGEREERARIKSLKTRWWTLQQEVDDNIACDVVCQHQVAIINSKHSNLSGLLPQQDSMPKSMMDNLQEDNDDALTSWNDTQEKGQGYKTRDKGPKLLMPQCRTSAIVQPSSKPNKRHVTMAPMDTIIWELPKDLLTAGLQRFSDGQALPFFMKTSASSTPSLPYIYMDLQWSCLQETHQPCWNL